LDPEGSRLGRYTQAVNSIIMSGIALKQNGTTSNSKLHHISKNSSQLFGGSNMALTLANGSCA